MTMVDKPNDPGYKEGEGMLQVQAEAAACVPEFQPILR